MGLTIHYKLSCADGPAPAIRQVVSSLRQRALALPFQEVGPLIELAGKACDFQQQPRNDPARWLLIQGRQSVVHKDCHYDVLPAHLFAFNTVPGMGCEPANFGLCQYPATINVPDERRTGRTRHLPTALGGWMWRSFCKTQYASNPDCGGTENFLRCHLMVIHLLDQARELGLLTEVTDEGGYWERRDIPAMARQVGGWNERIAAQVGQLKDLLERRTGNTVQVASAISHFPNFEHLEAAGGK
jgi:hypothetical protein